jgi:hypothetical protein
MIGKQTCDRCKAETLSTIMSKFNTEMICMDCKAKERAHPQYRAACDAELAQVQMGNYNFDGVGKPDDL